ncbi:unnamed protein product [Rotaria sp. Silwood2]|nr:unnamed protein product [Rotaria sp. Silwood2]CAF2649846.1 unnamed protein product [Rotaria sp. Silwood2]CAF2905842.1 unnamed protein product [Rotaria sp. Silwood2]CAF3057029.1 unnamed protein product [Rotaria sp. Silwood2]CAF3928371.1 unnamed protein product [Rotaria sp. Silwood2]
MVFYKVYSQERRIRYFARPCSTAILFQISCLFLTFLPPLFTGYFTSGFYYKELTYSEQANVTFLEEYHLIIDSISSLRFSSSDARLNNYFGSSYYPGILRTYLPRDVDDDGINDQHNITLTVILPSTISDQIINLWLQFQYSLNRYPLMKMKTLGLISLKAPSLLSATSSKVTVYGQLRFHQREPILSYENYSSLQDPIIDFGTYSLVPSFDDILDKYSSRNYFTTFDQQYVQWSSSPSTSSFVQLTINVIVNIGPQVYRYVPSFWKEFRWSWIQYFTSLLPFFYIANKVKEFVFSNGLVRTVIRKFP